MGVALPSGTVTFLFTDIAGSTRLWERHPDEMRQALARHDQLLADAVSGHRGAIFATGGDGFAAVFDRAANALLAAAQAQLALSAEPWPGSLALEARMAVHTGEVEERGGDYFGAAVNRAARLMAAAHPGQVLVSAATTQVVEIPHGLGLVELGRFTLKDLATPETVHQLTAAGLATAFPPPRALDGERHNLPAQVTSFVGRDADVMDLCELLGTARVVTLVAGGGSGKTRLALHAAAELVDAFEAVHLVPLAPIADPGLVATRVIETLGSVAVGDAPKELDRLVVDRIGPRRVLLVIDNCEHLIAECARLVNLMVERCPRLVVLTTSREVLGVSGEHVFPVRPLVVPSEHADAAAIATSAAGALFVERAKAVRPGFTLTDDNARAVGDICRRVEGLPLAVELAAARVRAMAPAQLARRLDDAHRVLAGAGRGPDARHHTIEACLDWSYRLLSADEATVLRRLAVFAGGCTLEAAESVCAGGGIDGADVDDLLAGLVDKSLVVVEDRGSELRYRLLELVRQFATARLESSGEADDVRGRHLDWFAEFVRFWASGVQGADLLAVERMRPEVDNLLGAVDWGLRHDAILPLVRLLGGGGYMWAHVRMMRQLAMWWDLVLPRLPEQPDETFPANRLALALCSAVAALCNVGQFASAWECLIRSEAIERVAAPTVGLRALMRGALTDFTGRTPDEILEVAGAGLPNAGPLTVALGCTQAQWLLFTGEPMRASHLLATLLDGAGQDDGSSWPAFGRALHGLADVLLGARDAGLGALHELVRSTGSTEANWLYPRILLVHGYAHFFADEADDTFEATSDALVANREWGITWGLPFAVELAGLALARWGDAQLGARALGAVDANYRAAGGKSPSAYPDTLLHPYRQALMATAGAAEQCRLGEEVRLTDMSERLVRHLQGGSDRSRRRGVDRRAVRLLALPPERRST